MMPAREATEVNEDLRLLRVRVDQLEAALRLLRTVANSNERAIIDAALFVDEGVRV